MESSTILVQDSILRFSSKIRSKINESDYLAKYFENASEAIEFIKKGGVELVVVSDLKILKEIKKFHSDKNISIVVAISDTSMAKYYIHEGATDFVNIALIEEDLLPRIDVSIHKCNRIKNLIDISNKDFLTNLYNRRYFYDKGNKIYQSNDNIALCVIDIDKFKNINDTYGHLAGDFVIKELANILKKNVKGKDLVARFGGDEFCVMFQDISEENTKKLLQNIEKTVADHVIQLGEKKISFTISTGMHCNKQNTFEEMFHLADLDLYNSKLCKKDERELEFA